MRLALPLLAPLVAAAAIAAAPLPAAHAATVITCESVDASESTVRGTSCNTGHWGPLSNFVIGAAGQIYYACHTGWAEGSLWVQGQNCRSIPRG